MSLNRFYPVILLSLLVACSEPSPASQLVTPEPITAGQEKNLQLISGAIYQSLTSQQRIGQLFMLHLPLRADYKVYRDMQPGGVFLDFRNTFTTRRGLARKQNYGRLVAALKELNQYYMKNNIPLPLYSIDQEGGYHKLLKPASYFTALMAVGEAAYSTGKTEWANYIGYYTCRDLRVAGIHWNLSPVADVQMNPQNPVIRTRSFHSDPGLVSSLVYNYLQGHQAARCLDSIKHFPGHGDTNRDSHHDLPIVKKTMKQLLKEDLRPFKEVIEKNGATGLMPAHIIYPRFEKKPATFSTFWLRKTLRQNWNYKGLVISDNLSMKAVPKFRKEKTFHKVGVDAIKAGIDVLLLTSHISGYGYQMHAGVTAEYKKNKAFRAQVEEAAKRVLYHKIKIGMLDDFLRQAKVASRPWIKGLEGSIDTWLAFSEKASKRKQPGILAPAELNRFIAEAAIKVLVGQKDTEKILHNSKKYVLFTDVKPSSKYYPQLKKLGVRIFSLEQLNRLAGQYKNAQVLNTRVVTLRSNIRRWASLRKKGRYVFYSVANPFPFRVIKAGLQKNDILISSFSKSRSSKKALVEAFLSRRVPPRAGVKYQ